MSEDELQSILSPYHIVHEGRYSWEKKDCYEINAVEIPKLILKIDVLWRGLKTEKAELEARVKVYEAIIENSNFKMAVVREKKEKA